jgi:hypothetical protein
MLYLSREGLLESAQEASGKRYNVQYKPYYTATATRLTLSLGFVRLSRPVGKEVQVRPSEKRLMMRSKLQTEEAVEHVSLYLDFVTTKEV